MEPKKHFQFQDSITSKLIKFLLDSEEIYILKKFTNIYNG